MVYIFTFFDHFPKVLLGDLLLLEKILEKFEI